MEMIVATIGSMLSAAGGWVAAAVAALVALLGGVAYHRGKVNKAEDKGREDGAAIERDRIRQGTEETLKELERKADEVEDKVRRDTATDDDLRQRMRDAAKADDRGVKP